MAKHTVLDPSVSDVAAYARTIRSSGRYIAVVGSSDFATALAAALSGHEVSLAAETLRTPDCLVVAPDEQPFKAEPLIAQHPKVDLIYAGRPSPFVAVIALHKSGTNLITSLMRLLGYTTLGEGTGRSTYPDGLWEAHEATTLARLEPKTAYVAHSLPLPTIGGRGQEPRPLFTLLCDEEWPVIFHYRDPRAVLSSLVNYLTRSSGDYTAAPFHNMVARLLSATEPARRLDVAMMTLDSYLSWSFTENAWLLNAPFALTSSYEALVGERGGGNDLTALMLVRRILMALHVSGDAESLVATAYDTSARTFHRGSAVAWRADYTVAQILKFDELYGTILDRYGYPRVDAGDLE